MIFIIRHMSGAVPRTVYQQSTETVAALVVFVSCSVEGFLIAGRLPACGSERLTQVLASQLAQEIDGKVAILALVFGADMLTLLRGKTTEHRL
jgi:hypothetical protein